MEPLLGSYRGLLLGIPETPLDPVIDVSFLLGSSLKVSLDLMGIRFGVSICFRCCYWNFPDNRGISIDLILGNRIALCAIKTKYYNL